MDVSAAELAIALVVMVLAAGVQSVIGFGLAVTSVPLLALLDPVLAPVPQLLVALPLSLAMVARDRGHIDLRGVGWILAGRVPGAAIGFAMLVSFAPRGLAVVIALFVLAIAVVMASGATIPRNPVTQFAAGTASGVGGLVASIGGPPVALLFQDSAGGTLRSSLAAVFSIGIVMSIALRVVAGRLLWDEVVVALAYLPAVWVGFVVAGRLLHHVEGPRLRRVVLAVSAGSALALLVRSVA